MRELSDCAVEREREHAVERERGEREHAGERAIERWGGGCWREGEYAVERERASESECCRERERE